MSRIRIVQTVTKEWRYDMFAWSRNFYAMANGRYFCFETKKDRDDAVQNYGFQKVTAIEAYDNYPFIKIEWRAWRNRRK